MLDTGYRILDTGYRIQLSENDYCFFGLCMAYPVFQPFNY